MKRLVFITGHYGSGKTEIALNLAIQRNYNWIVDLDGINPYFRTREHELLLTTHHIHLVSTDVPNGSYIDTPFISKYAFTPFQNHQLSAIYDLGGSQIGARVMRQFSDYDFYDVDFLLVVNIFRQETSTVAKIMQVIDEIQSSSGRKLTGLIHNSNLLRETTKEDYADGIRIISEVSSLTQIPVVLSTGLPSVYSSMIVGDWLDLKLYLRKDWL